jgi:hypothetical protein
VESRRLASLLVLVPVAVFVAGCGGRRLSATDVANLQRKLEPTVFADISCAPDPSSGWDYVCTYTDPHLGREKMGVVLVLHGHAFTGSGSSPANGFLPEGPHLKNSGAEYARRANVLCAERAAAVRALPKAKSQYEVLDRGERIRQLEAIEESKLVGINPPADEKDDVAAFIASIDRVQRAIENFRDAFSRRNGADVAKGETRLAAARQESNSIARRLGLSCRH